MASQTSNSGWQDTVTVRLIGRLLPLQHRRTLPHRLRITDAAHHDTNNRCLIAHGREYNGFTGRK